MKKIAKIGVAMLALLSASGVQAEEMKKVSISTIVEVPALTDTKTGIIEGLAERGYIDGKTISIDYQSANGNMPTQQQIAKKFVGDHPDVIIPITTPTSQAVIALTKDIPIVFATVTDPLKAQLITQFKQPGGNVTGVSDAAPIGAQLDLFLELMPALKKIGFIYNPGLDSAVSALEVLKENAEPRGIEVVEAVAPTTNEVLLATKKLIGKVDAIYVPNDTTVVSALEAIVKIGQDVKLPIFTGETGGVERGAAGSVGLDYIAVGKVAGFMAADVLDGKDVGTIDAVIAYEVQDKFALVINKGSAEKMGLTIPQSVLDRATTIIE